MKRNLVGLTGKANNGQTMTIIAYRHTNDIDVMFEDGTIVHHRSLTSFNKGSVRNPTLSCNVNRRNKKIGEVALANNGQMMKIIEYRSSKDIDVQFEDGTIVKNRAYHNFIRGEIWNANSPTVRVPRNNRTGVRKMANCGQEMTIIAYRGCSDIDVQFEDGTIVYHRTYKTFVKGSIENPKLKEDFRRSKIGETSMSNNGQKMTLIAYRSANDIDVQFEDGAIVESTRYPYFKRGAIANPRRKKTSDSRKKGQAN